MRQSRLVTWDSARGYGYTEAEGRKLFVHHRDFVRKNGRPRQGDRIQFLMGQDERGRACAVAVEALGDRRTLRFRDLLTLAVLLVLPGLALARVPISPWIPVGLVLIFSWITWREYRLDKQQARLGGRRVPERTLQILSFFAGWPGAFLAQRQFRHKTVKTFFQLEFWAIVLFHQVAAADFLLGWPLGRMLVGTVQDLLSRLPT